MDIAYAREFRAKSLDEYIGDDIKNKLKNWLKDEKSYPQSILIYGPPGTGKTSLARLIAKEVLCVDKHDGHSCGKCINCMTIEDELINAEYGVETMGISEINVGVDGGKDKIVELTQDVLLAPPFGYKYRIFILDECHMMTKQAQNALLKMLEEMPSTSIIILCTTDPNKLLETVRDRCQLKVQTKPADFEDLLSRLKYICEVKKLRTSEDALKLIIKQNKRNPRNSITAIENIAKNYDHDVTINNVLKEYNVVSIDRYEHFIKGAQGANPIAATLQVCAMLDTDGISYKDFLEGLIDFTTTCISIKYGIGIENETQEALLAAKRLFTMYNMGEMDCFLQILEYAAKMMYNGQSSDKLTLILTALRISKVQLLEQGLQYVEKNAHDETEKGSDIYVENLKAEQVEAKPLEVSDSTLNTVFGKQIKEISSGHNIRIADDEDDDTLTAKEEEKLAKSEDMVASLTDEQFMAMFHS